MALFRRKGPEIVRKSSAEGKVEERKTVRVKGQKVEVRRVEAPKPQKPKTPANKRKSRTQQSKGRNGIATSRTRSRRPMDDEIILPPESARKQMLVSVSNHQTQIVILEPGEKKPVIATGFFVSSSVSADPNRRIAAD